MSSDRSTIPYIYARLCACVRESARVRARVRTALKQEKKRRYGSITFVLFVAVCVCHGQHKG
jgi:hypothetical protein